MSPGFRSPPTRSPRPFERYPILLRFVHSRLSKEATRAHFESTRQQFCFRFQLTEKITHFRARHFRVPTRNSKNESLEDPSRVVSRLKVIKHQEIEKSIQERREISF